MNKAILAAPTEPNKLLGAPRALTMFNVCLSVLLVMVFSLWWFVGFSVVLQLVFLHLGKEEPWMAEILLRHVRQHSFYET